MIADWGEFDEELEEVTRTEMRAQGLDENSIDALLADLRAEGMLDA